MKQKVLIVDDSLEILQSLGESIRGFCDVMVARSGAKALESVAEDPPDLILLDILMPEMDGYEVCSRLKNDPTTSDIPVLFVTSLTEEEDEAKGLELGAIDYIVKPANPHIVRARVKNHLEMKRQREMLEQLCSIDSLTCIPNRRRFDDALKQEWSRCIRSAQPISLIMLDIDFFKAYNDNNGHPAGDECLSLVAQTLHDSMRRGGDLVARYGGEEFIVLLPETELEGAVVVAQMLTKAIDALNITHHHSEVADKVTVSIGVATTVPRLDCSHETLLEAADNALYEAKENGRNQVRTKGL